MKKNELRQLIKEEIQKALKQHQYKHDSKSIIDRAKNKIKKINELMDEYGFKRGQ